MQGTNSSTKYARNIEEYLKNMGGAQNNQAKK